MMGWFRKLIRSFRFLQFVSAIRWGLAGNIVIAWFVTMPPACVIAAASYWVAGLVG